MRRQKQKNAFGPTLILAGIALLAVMFSLSKPKTVRAEPADLSSAAAKYPNIAGTALDSCDLCHTSVPDLNPYGAAYLAAGRNSAAFGLIESLDSDNDGFTNIQEIGDLTFPGDPASFPIVATATSTPTQTATMTTVAPTATATPTNTWTFTPTNTSTLTPTSTATNTSAVPPTNTSTVLPTNTPTLTLTSTATFTATNTSAVTPTSTSTFTPTNTSAVTPTNGPTFTPPNTQTNTPTDTPTSTPTNTPTRTPTDTPTSTPTNTPTSTPTPLSNTPGKVTGGGNLKFPGEKVSFGFVLRYSNGALTPAGNLIFKDHASSVSLKATSFKLLSISGTRAVLTGYGTVNGEPNVAFTVIAADGGAPGSPDTFSIQIPALNGYSVGGVLSGGKIQISAP